MKTARSFSVSVTAIQERIQYIFRDPLLLEKALTHPSVGGQFFQRLEFLGDRVLGLTIAQWLYETFPNDPEGTLTKKLANMVNRTALNRVAEHMKLSLYILSDTEMSYTSRVMADTCEAVLGAIYLDSDLETVQRIIRILWKPLLDENTHAPSVDAKTALQEYLQGEKRPLPTYHLIAQLGSSHNPTFHIRLNIADADAFTGIGKSKKEAEQNAAQTALLYYTSQNV